MSGEQSNSFEDRISMPGTGALSGDTEISTEDSLEEAALRIAQRYPVFPVRPRSKVPATAHGFYDATRDPNQIAQWWNERPEANIGLRTGHGLLVLDVDSAEGERWLRDKLVPTTAIVRTARGCHRYYEAPLDIDLPSRSGIGPGVDVKSERGYIVAPPSVHPSGHVYSWAIDEPVAPCPSWLLNLESDNRKAAHDATSWADLLSEKIESGRRHTEICRIAGLLLTSRAPPLPARVAAELVLAVNDARCVPPLPTDEVERVIDDIAARELAKRERRYAR